MALGVALAILGERLTGILLRNDVFSTYASLAYIVSSALFLMDLIRDEGDDPVASKPEFWLFSAFLTYGSGTLLFNGCSNYFLRRLPEHLILLPWLANAIILAFCNILQTKVFLCPKPRSS
nr:hypothetical protein [uncultured Holophaga sp.]